MANSTGARYFTLIQRELQEYKVSLVLTPIVIAGVLAVLMLGSVLFANQITAMGGTFMKVVVSEPGGLPVIRINIDDEAPDPTGADKRGSSKSSKGGGGCGDEHAHTRAWGLQLRRDGRRRRSGLPGSLQADRRLQRSRNT